MFNSFAGAYSEANTIIVQSINKGLEQSAVESAAIAAVIPKISSLSLDTFGGNTMALFGDKECIQGKTHYQSMVIFATLAVIEAVLKTKGLELSSGALDVACSTDIVRTEVSVYRVATNKGGKTEEEMAELAANDEGGCGGACAI